MLKRKELVLEVSTSPVENIKSFRRITESNEWEITSHEGSRLVDRFAIIMPMAQSARTLGIEVLDGPLRGLEIHTWAETKGSAGAINMALGQYLVARVMKRRERLFVNGQHPCRGAHGSGLLENVVGLATYCLFFVALARHLPSLD